MGLIGLGYHHDAGGISVEPVDYSGAKILPATRKLISIINEAIYQCTMRIAPRRVDDKVGLLVEDDYVVIFEDDIERDIFGYEFGDLLWGQNEVQFVAWVEFVARFGGSAVDVYSLLADQFLQSCPAEMIESSSEILIEPAVFDG